MLRPDSLSTETPLAMVTVPCPVCGRPVRVVVDVEARCARWCCLACRTVGKSPCAIGEEPDPNLLAGAASA